MPEPSPYAGLHSNDRSVIDAALAACKRRDCDLTRDSIAADIIATRARAAARTRGTS